MCGRDLCVLTGPCWAVSDPVGMHTCLCWSDRLWETAEAYISLADLVALFVIIVWLCE